MNHRRRFSLPGTPSCRERPRRHLPLLVLALAALLWPIRASAAPFVEVKYDLSDSTAVTNIENLVTTSVPPDGVLTGTQTIRYVSDSSSGLATGPAKLLTFDLYVHATPQTFGFTSGGAQTYLDVATSDLHIELIGTVGATAGSRLPGGTVTVATASGVFRVTGYMHCLYKPQCQFLGHPYSSRVPIVPDTFTAPFPSLTGALGQPHTVRGTATSVKFRIRPYVTTGPLPIALGVVGTTFVVGREIQRTPTLVPEPGTLSLAALGVAVLGLAAVGRYRMTRGA